MPSTLAEAQVTQSLILRLRNLWLNRKRKESSSVLQGLPSLSQMLVRFDTEEERIEQGFGLNVHLVRESKVVAFSKSNTPRPPGPVLQPLGLGSSFATRTQTPCKSSGSREILILIYTFGTKMSRKT